MPGFKRTGKFAVWITDCSSSLLWEKARRQKRKDSYFSKEEHVWIMTFLQKPWKKGPIRIVFKTVSESLKGSYSHLLCFYFNLEVIHARMFENKNPPDGNSLLCRLSKTIVKKWTIKLKCLQREARKHCMTVHWLALLPHSERVMNLNPGRLRPLWVEFALFAFLLQSKDRHVGLLCDSKLVVVANTGMDSSLSQR